MKKPKVQNCDGCNTKLHPDRTLILGIGEPVVTHYICYPCALKLNDGDTALDAVVMATARKRHQSPGVLAA